MCILEKLNFKISRGSMPPGPPIETVPSALDHIIAGPTLNYFRWACYYQWVIVSIILRILITQKHFSFFTRKRCTFRIIQKHKVHSSLKCTPPPPHPPAERAAYAPGNALKLVKFCIINYAKPVFSFFFRISPFRKI